VTESTTQEIKRFHYVSKVILRGFSGSLGAQRQMVMMLRRKYFAGRARPKSPNSLCYLRREELKPPDPVTFEAVWNNAFEGRFHEMMDAVRDRTLLQSPDLRIVLADCVAVHLARSLTIVQMVESELSGVFEDTASRAKGDPRLSAFYAARHGGLVLPGPEGARIAAEDLEKWLAEEFSRQPIAADRFLEHFPKMSTYCRTLGIKVAVANDREFLIGDIPALTVHPDHPEIGILQGLKLGDEQSILMPLDRHHSVSLQRLGNSYVEMADSEVESFNRNQIKGSQSTVMWHPSAHLADFVRSVMNEASGPQL
jgi:hypothetical protein